MSSKEPTTPLERSLKKMDVLMRSFGMRTRLFKSQTRAIVKGSRKVYPYELNATLVETARGVGIRIRLEKLWYSFLKLIPFLLIIIFSILQATIPNAGIAIANATGVNLFLLILGPNPNGLGIWISLPIIAGLIIGSEILERVIRSRYIQDRMPKFLSGAEWNVSEPPIALDLISSANNLLWLLYAVLIIIFAPMIFHEDIFSKFIGVYEVDAASLLSTTTLISVIDVAIMGGMMFAVLYQSYEKFRGTLDRHQFRSDIRFESNVRQLVQAAIGATMFSTLMLTMFYFTFWSRITIVQVIIFYLVTIVASLIGVWLYWQKESYIFIAMAIWFLLSVAVMIFLNANDTSYSWMIICHLFLILVSIGLSLNRYFEKLMVEKGILEPSWYFNLFPIFAYLAAMKKRSLRLARGVEKELEEILEEDLKDKVKVKEPLIIDISKIKKKGKEALKILDTYQKILSLIVKGEINIGILVDINNIVLDMIKDEKQIHKEAKQVFKVVDSLLWDDKYILKEGQKILKSIENVHDKLVNGS
ncbi:MAG: hypothetical protein GOP50_03645 [Candidatus Heimdallarchaeota archaeon]|nr:hypothetical protein [Candidatus Heimdallarchaeota archaeon]